LNIDVNIFYAFLRRNTFFISVCLQPLCDKVVIVFQMMNFASEML